MITRLMPSLLALLSGVDECGGLGPSAVDGDGERPHLGDVGIRAPCEELPAGLADLVPVGASSGQSEEAAQVLLGDPRPQQGLPDCPSRSAFHIVANCSSVRSSRLRSRRRRADHSPSVARPRRLRTSAVRQLHHVEVVDHDPGMRQAGADRGAVGGGHADGDVCDALSPGQRGGGEPGQHVGDAAVLDLAQQPARPEGVDEAGVPPIACPARLPVSGSCSQRGLPRRVSPMPSTSTPARCVDDLTGLVAEGMRSVGQDRCRSRAAWTTVEPGVAYPAFGRDPQSHGHPRAGR